MGILSAFVAVKFVQLLARPFEQWDAYKMGLIDKRGKKLRSAKTAAEREQFSSWMNLVRNTKRAISTFPGGSSLLGTIATAYLLLKDSNEGGMDEWEWKALLEEHGFPVPEKLVVEVAPPDSFQPGKYAFRPGLVSYILEERYEGPIFNAHIVQLEGSCLGVRAVRLIDTVRDREILCAATELIRL